MIERTCGHNARGSPRRSAAARHPGHVAVLALGEKALEPRLGVRGRIRARHADDVEALPARRRG